MKARIKETGEIFNVEEYVLDDGYNYEPKDVEIIVEESFDKLSINWEKRRFELVKAAMQGYISNEGREYMHTESSMKNTAELCVKFADAVLAEYRKGGEE